MYGTERPSSDSDSDALADVVTSPCTCSSRKQRPDRNKAGYREEHCERDAQRPLSEDRSLIPAEPLQCAPVRNSGQNRGGDSQENQRKPEPDRGFVQLHDLRER
jgi:hypothetical protein